MRTVVVALAIVVAAGCGGESQRAQPTASVAEAGGRIAGTTLAGDTVSLDQFRGRPVLVNVWSSW